MSQQLFRVMCECGKAHDVPAGAAGSTLTCGCGKTVEVPVFSKLREAVVQSSGTSESVYRALLQTGQLPRGRTCVKCRRETDHAATITVRCKQRVDPVLSMKAGLLLSVVSYFPLASFILPMVMLKALRERGLPEEVVFDFPIRVCPECERHLATDEAALNAVERVTLYADILAKHKRPRVVTKPTA